MIPQFPCSLPTDASRRNEFPMADGLLDYFPNALAEVARLSKVGNDQHNPGQPMHWARDKSTDHANKVVKHLIDRGKFDTDGIRHSVKAAWRALALAQEELEQDEGYPPPRNAIAEHLPHWHKDWGKPGSIISNDGQRNSHPMASETLREQDFARDDNSTGV
jgi:DNA-binding transcriptional MocR family regulator